jgi:hypothetical protein
VVMRAIVLFAITQEICGLCRDRRGMDTVEGYLEVRRVDDQGVGVDGHGVWQVAAVIRYVCT